jgi:hypothetical protein
MSKIKTGDIVWVDTSADGGRFPTQEVGIVGMATSAGWWVLFYGRGQVAHFRSQTMTLLREATGDQVIEALKLINGEYDHHRHYLDDKYDLCARWKAAWIKYAGDFYGWEAGNPIENRVIRNNRNGVSE